MRAAIVIAALVLTSLPARAQTTDAVFPGLKWRNVSHMLGGRATTGVGVPTNSQLYYAGYTGGGLWKTENAGRSWENISDGFFNVGSIGDIAVFAKNPSIIYVGTGEGPARGEMSTYGDGMYKSVDAGKTWTRIGLEDTKQIARVVTHPTDPNIVYVAGQGDQWSANSARGVFRSTDGGVTWKRILYVSDLTGASDLVMDPNNPKVLYAGMWDHLREPRSFRTIGPGSGLWKSTDGGDTWIQIKNGLPTTLGKVRIAIAPSNPKRVYVNIEADDGGGIYRSEDSGATWKLINGSRAVRSRAWYYLGLTVDPKNPDVIYDMAAALIKSTDGGASFKRIPFPHMDDSHSLWINPTNPQNMILTSDGGAVVSFDGGVNWSTEENQATAQFYNVQVDDLFPYNLYGGQQDRGTVKIANRTFGGGRNVVRTWSTAGGGETGRFAFNPKDPRTVFVTNYSGSIEAFDTETGMSRPVSEWPQELLGTGPRKNRFNWSAAMAVSPTNPKVVYHGGASIFRTEDGGYHWTQISPDLTKNPPGPLKGVNLAEGGAGADPAVYDLAESPLDAKTIWAGTDDGQVQVTRDGGAHWANVTPAHAKEGWVMSVEVSPHDKATAYFALSRLKWHDNNPYLYKTTDYGRSWTNIGASFPEGFPARVVREDPKRRDLLFAGTENALWLSYDGGEHWQSLQMNLPHVPVSDLKIRHDDLIASTEGRSFWILDDITPLELYSAEIAKTPVHLFKPHDTYRIVETGAGGDPPGDTSPTSAAIWYSLAAKPAAPAGLKLDILDAKGKVIRAITGADMMPEHKTEDPKDKKPPEPVLTANVGVNRFQWNLRTAPRENAVGPGGVSPAKVHDGVMGDPLPIGTLVPSGSYTVRMSVGGAPATQSLSLRSDPRLNNKPAWEIEHATMAEAITVRSVDVNAAITKLKTVRRKAEEIFAKSKIAAVQDFLAHVNEVERKLLENRYDTASGSQDFLVYPPGLISEYSYLLGIVDSAPGPLTQAEKDRFQDLETQWSSLQAAAQTVLTAELARVNAALTAGGQEALKVD